MMMRFSTTLFLKAYFFIWFLFVTSFLSAQGFVGLQLNSTVDKVQPMTGIVFWSANQGDLNTLGDKVQLEYSYMIYADVVENEGDYDWGVVDDLLSTAAARGRQVILRFRYTYPGERDPSVPQYIRNRSDYTDQTERVEGANTYIPDWSNGELEDFTLEFFTKFAARYDKDPRLAFVQVGFGSYSEYHLYNGDLRFGETFPTKAYQATFLQHVDRVFKETQWSISIDAASSEYTPIANNTTLLNLGYGLFDDSFLHEQHSTSNNEYNRANWLTFGANRADTRAAGGELNYYSQNDQETVLDVQGPYGFTFEEMAEMYDISYMIGNDQLKYQSASRIEDAAMATGYHFEVTSFATNGSFTIVTIKNNGIAPLYYDAYPAVNGTRSDTSLKGLLAGQSRTFSINAVAGNQELSIASDRLVSGQEIQFDANLKEGTLAVGSIALKNTITLYPNPFQESLTVINKRNSAIEVTLYTVLGKAVHEEIINSGRQLIDTDALAAGFYIVKLKDSTSSATYSSVFVKK